MYMLGRKKKRRERYAISGLVHPCNLAGFRVTLSKVYNRREKIFAENEVRKLNKKS